MKISQETLDRIRQTSTGDLAFAIHQATGISPKEIAQMLGKSERSVAGAVYRRKRTVARRYGKAA